MYSYMPASHAADALGQRLPQAIAEALSANAKAISFPITEHSSGGYGAGQRRPEGPTTLPPHFSPQGYHAGIPSCHDVGQLVQPRRVVEHAGRLDVPGREVLVLNVHESCASQCIQLQEARQTPKPRPRRILNRKVTSINVQDSTQSYREFGKCVTQVYQLLLCRQKARLTFNMLRIM